MSRGIDWRKRLACVSPPVPQLANLFLGDSINELDCSKNRVDATLVIGKSKLLYFPEAKHVTSKAQLFFCGLCVCCLNPYRVSFH